MVDFKISESYHFLMKNIKKKFFFTKLLNSNSIDIFSNFIKIDNPLIFIPI